MSANNNGLFWGISIFQIFFSSIIIARWVYLEHQNLSEEDECKFPRGIAWSTILGSVVSVAITFALLWSGIWHTSGVMEPRTKVFASMAVGVVFMLIFVLITQNIFTFNPNCPSSKVSVWGGGSLVGASIASIANAVFLSRSQF